MKHEIVNLHSTELPEIGDLVQLLPVPLSPDEWSDRATASAMLGGEIAGLEAGLKEGRTRIRAEIRMLQEERVRCDRAIRDQSEDRPVGVRVLADLAGGCALLVRVDTGEVIDRRSLTEGEVARASQRVLDFPVM